MKDEILQYANGLGAQPHVIEWLKKQMLYSVVSEEQFNAIRKATLEQF